jgi:uncharacterized membrane protein YeaQ/YmgE (transglycosylase-associated protein family)
MTASHSRYRRIFLGFFPGQSLRLALLSLILGVAGAVAASRVLSGFLYHMHGLDTASFAVAGLTLTLVTLVATFIPVFQATSIDPIEALRALSLDRDFRCSAVGPTDLDRDMPQFFMLAENPPIIFGSPWLLGHD